MLSITEFSDGTSGIDIRQFFTKDEENYFPTSKGCYCPKELIDELIEKIQKVKERINNNG